MSERHIQLEGVYNLRDLGGYPTQDGHQTSWGKIYRSDNLHRISPSAQQQLIELGLRDVIDLRRPNETEKAVDVFATSNEVAYHNLSIQNVIPFEEGKVRFPDLTSMYTSILDNYPEVIKRVLQVILESDGAVLFHCAIGKDRTGVIAGLLLDIAGVAHPIIAEDYSLTSQCLEPIMPEILSGRPAHLTPEQFQHYVDSDPETMLGMLSHLSTKYGGSEQYLKSIGFSQDEIDSLRAKLIN